MLRDLVRELEMPNVTVISRYRVNRGGVSTLTAWLGGMSWLLEHVSEWDYYINLNDSDYPVAKLESLQRFLWLNQGANFINVGSAYKDCDCGRYLVFECKDELYSIAPELQYPRRPQLQHASGPNLVAITKDMAMYIDRNRNIPGTAVQNVLEDLSILQQPDEKFFQILGLNEPLLPPPRALGLPHLGPAQPGARRCEPGGGGTGAEDAHATLTVAKLLPTPC
ncbi:unnamed protein product [Durusdinium trenchii]|uniref:protein xylosyltransferase n=1 Tax=Durusdinium trenchii TaxID=1381693 RepID=A0ABP0HSG9_9DINO